MKFLSAKKKENAPAPSSSTHYLRHEAPRRPLDALPVERDAHPRSKPVSKSRNASPSRGPYPFSRAFFSQSTPSIARAFHSHDAHVPPPPVPPLPREGIVTSTASPSFFSLKRRPRVDSAQREASASKPDLSAPATRPTRPRTRSFGAYLSLGSSSASGAGKRGAHAAAQHDCSHAPELPPLPPVSALRIFDDGGRLQRPAHVEPLSPRTPRKKRIWTPVKAASSNPLPPAAMRPQTARAVSEPPPEIVVTPRRGEQVTPRRDEQRRTSPVPVLDGVWQGFLAEIEEDISCMDLHGALKASLELDWPCGSSPARSTHLRATPTRATSESALPYLLRTPTASSTTICPPRPHASPSSPVRSPMRRCATEADAEHLLTRAASNFSLSLFPLPPAGAPEPLPCHPGAFIPSRPAPRPPTLAPPPRERHTTPPKPLFPPHPAPLPQRPARRPQTASSTSSSSSAWDDLFDADSESARTGRCSSRATSVSHTHSQSNSHSHAHHREKPSTCDFFSVGATEVKWGYAV